MKYLPTRVAWPTALALVCLCAAGTAQGQEERQEEDAAETFRLLFERNIFDPERSAMRAEEPEPQGEVEIPAPEDYLQLAGILITDDTAVAFFEGSRPAYVTALLLDEYIDNLLLIEVSTEGVVFFCENEEVNLPVGAALTRGAEGPWHIGEVRETLAPDAGTEDEGGEKDVEATEDSAADSLLEQLRKRREQELGNE